MTDLHEIAMESLGWTPEQAMAILGVVERDRRGAIPTVPQCCIDRTVTMGSGARVWHFAVVLQDVVLGDDVNIGSGCEIGRGTVIGNRSRIGAHTFLPPNSRIGSDVFVGPGCVFTDDLHPRVPAPGDPPYDARPPVIEHGASIGAGAVILPGVTIGAHARVAAGCTVTEDVPPGQMVIGQKAKRRTVPLLWRTGTDG